MKTLVLTDTERRLTAKVLLGVDKEKLLTIGKAIKEAWEKKLLGGDQPGMMPGEFPGALCRTIGETLNTLDIEYGQITTEDTVIVTL